MNPEKRKFYTIIDGIRKDKKIADNEKECYKAKCVELREAYDDLSKMVRSSDQQNANLHNIIQHQNEAYKATRDALDTRTQQLNCKIDENNLLEAKVQQLKAQLEQALNNYPPSNARVVELKVVKDEHKTDIG